MCMHYSYIAIAFDFHYPVGTYCSDLHKMLYLENRKFLPHDCTLRTESHGFPNNSEESNPPPTKKRFCDIKKLHRAYENELLRYLHVICLAVALQHTVAI